MTEIGRKNVIQDEFMMENPSSSNIHCPINMKVIKYSNVLDVNVCIWLNIGKQINFNYDLGMVFKNSSFVFNKMRCFLDFCKKKKFEAYIDLLQIYVPKFSYRMFQILIKLV